MRFFWNFILDDVNGFYAASWAEVEPHKCSPFRSHYRKRLPCFSDANLATFACVVFLLSLCRFESYIQMPNWCLSVSWTRSSKVVVV